jgi:hypothetical protein
MKKFILLAGIVLISALIMLYFIQRESVATLRNQNQAQQQQLAQLAAENQRLSKPERKTGTQQGLSDDHLIELLRLRNEVSTLRRLTNAPRLVEHVTLVGDVSVAYDPAVWKLLLPSGDSLVRSRTWEITEGGWIQIIIGKYPERKTESDYKQQQLDVQLDRGSPAELVAERHEDWGGHEWFVLEFHNSHYRPARLEIKYFLPTDDGHISLLLVGEEASVSAHREAIEAFLSQVRVDDEHSRGTSQ